MVVMTRLRCAHTTIISVPLGGAPFPKLLTTAPLSSWRAQDFPAISPPPRGGARSGMRLGAGKDTSKKSHGGFKSI